MSVGSYLKTNWFILVLTVGFGAWGVYATFLTHDTRHPTFVVDPNRVEILSAERAATAPIKVLRRDGSPIRGDIYAVRFYIWNAGKLSIRPENVLDTIRISLDSGSEILDYKPLKTSRPITRVRLAPDPPGRQLGHGLRTLAVGFSILERDDGLAGQVIYEGKRDARLVVSGSVEGVPGGIANPQVPSFWSVARRHRAAVLGGIAACLVVPSLLWLIINAAMCIRKGLRFAVPKGEWAGVVKFSVLIALGVLIITSFVIGLNQWDKPPATVVSMVPERLLP